jgi:hypothetical protein
MAGHTFVRTLGIGPVWLYKIKLNTFFNRPCLTLNKIVSTKKSAALDLL